MAKALTTGFIRKAPPGKYYDRDGLYLRVKETGSRQWMQRLTVRGRRIEIGLGGFPLVSLDEARDAAFENKRFARDGGDPRALRSGFGIPKFRDAVEAVLAIHEPTWKDGSKTAALWRSTLATYAMPRLGETRVDQISTADVMSALVPLWNKKPETARKLRQRISAIMKWSVAQGYRQDNPAGEILSAALPSNGGKTRHFTAVPWQDVPAALGTIQGSEAAATTKLALEFLILTACRSGEVRGARWNEIDMDAALWTVPAERTKTGRPHRVPLSGSAVAVLRSVAEYADRSGLVFPSVTGRQLSDSTMSKLLRENGVPGVPHGFRSSFRDWCAECTNAPREIAEACLAHVVKSKVEAAYALTDHFDKRSKLMAQWAAYLSGRGADVVPIGEGRRHARN